MSTLAIARHALPLLVSSCELLEFNMNFAGEGWHLNATCDFRIEVAGHIYTDESAPEELREVERNAVGRSIVSIESNADMDDPTFYLDDGTRISLTADPDDPYEPWTMRIPNITLLGSSPAQVKAAKLNQAALAPGELTALGEVIRVQKFPPGWSMSGDNWHLVVSCPWQRSSAGAAQNAQSGDVPDVYIGRRIDRFEYETHRCAIEFDDGSRIDVTADDGRQPWFLRYGDDNELIVGQPFPAPSA
ncbi:hypothetical protein [Gordonia terrae]|uniref:hypothetical protein n=1 Tax=Gordonia terrae TaxID=2055 RepID=UPI003F6B9A19